MADEELRPLLFSIAYRMLGSVADAQDVVQEAFLRYQRAIGENPEQVASPKAYLCAVTTHLAIDHLRSARVRREKYVGVWLPEPLLTDPDAGDVAAHLETAESLSMAFLVLLERLSPVERAVFLLHDVFDYGYGEIAAIVGRSEENCRQIATRARRHVREHTPRFEASRRRREELADRFFAAVGHGDMDGLVGLLAADVAVYGDGGGKAPSWRKPIFGAETVAKLFAGLGRQLQEHDIAIRRTVVNGQPGATFHIRDGRLISVMSLDIVEGRVQTVRSVINPEKLRHLGPVADVLGMLRSGRG